MKNAVVAEVVGVLTQLKSQSAYGSLIFAANTNLLKLTPVNESLGLALNAKLVSPEGEDLQETNEKWERARQQILAEHALKDDAGQLKLTEQGAMQFPLTSNIQELLDQLLKSDFPELVEPMVQRTKAYQELLNEECACDLRPLSWDIVRVDDAGELRDITSDQLLVLMKADLLVGEPAWG